jgi:DNA processing protein
MVTAWEASVAELRCIDGIGGPTAISLAQQRLLIDPLQLLEEHSQKNPNFWTPADPNYPLLLRQIADPPPVLYYRGIVDPAENQSQVKAIAIVGTRSPTDYGRRWTRKLTLALVRAGITVVSGLAEGIDAEAHRVCTQEGGRTIAVMGTGLDIVYPWSNRALARQIRKQGLLLSEYPAGTQPDRVNFPRRNRIIAGLCCATLVLEAPKKSGALITTRLANDYGREVYALPGSLDNQASQGCLELINQGAQMILSEDDLLEKLGALPQFQLVSDQLSLFPVPPELEPILQAVHSEPIAIDLIVQQVGRATGDVLSALAQLELMGLVTQLPGMRYQRV